MLRKATKTTRGPNVEEKAFVKWIKEERQACTACYRAAPLIAHHCEGATFKHNKVLVGHWFVIGLCEACDDVITQGSRKAFRDKFGAQSDCWEGLILSYLANTGARVPDDIHDAIMDWGK